MTAPKGPLEVMFLNSHSTEQVISSFSSSLSPRTIRFPFPSSLQPPISTRIPAISIPRIHIPYFPARLPSIISSSRIPPPNLQPPKPSSNISLSPNKNTNLTQQKSPIPNPTFFCYPPSPPPFPGKKLDHYSITLSLPIQNHTPIPQPKPSFQHVQKTI